MTDLGNRMKMYEQATKSSLVPRMPILIRIDGKAFHTFTRGCKKPFDENLHAAMDYATYRLVNEIQGAILGYTQSDEISLLLQCDAKNESQAWFGGNVQKIASVASSMATAYFNNKYKTDALYKVAMFDARVWNMSWEDVPNYFVWRNKDWYRNSVSMATLAQYSHTECNKKSVVDMMEMLYSIGAPWQNLSDRERNGYLVVPQRFGASVARYIKYQTGANQFTYASINQLITDLRHNEAVKDNNERPATI